jgi:hypothetical protein
MDLTSIVTSIETSALGEWMRLSLKAMPVVESLHVLAIAVVFGTILVVDLRLLGLPNTRRAFTLVSGELLRFTWAAFVLATITGAMMFAANASTYFDNTAFRFKMLALVAAGVNMAVFHGVTQRGISRWDKNAPPPAGARLAGAASILIWITVVVLGRLVGFTKGYDFAVPEGLEFEFETLLNDASSQ